MMNMCTRLATATLATSLPRGFLLEVLQRVEYKYTSGQHVDVDCEVCNRFMAKSKGGRQKKAKKCGCPNRESSKGIANSVLKNAPKSWRGSQPLHMARFLPPSTSLSLLDLLCVVCHCIVDRPVETTCRKMIYAHCISGLVLEADLSAIQCPCCPESPKITSSCFPPALDVVLKVMGALLVHCDNSLLLGGGTQALEGAR